MTQADVNNGSINDSAIATGAPPSGPPTDSPPSTTTVPVTQTSALTILKSATPSPNPITAAGQTVTYHFAVTNTGDVTLTNVHVTDTQTPPASPLASPPTCQTGTCTTVGSSSTTLAPGQSATFVATYTVTQADIDHGSIHDSAIATGTPPNLVPMNSTPSTATVPVTQTSTLTIEVGDAECHRTR